MKSASNSPVLGSTARASSRVVAVGGLPELRSAEWLAGKVNRASGREVDVRVRDNLIAIVRDPAVAATLWARIGGEIQISEQCRAALGEGFAIEERGTIDVKGKGQLRTFWLKGHQGFRAEPSDPQTSVAQR